MKQITQFFLEGEGPTLKIFTLRIKTARFYLSLNFSLP